MNEPTECSCRDQIQSLKSQRRSGNCRLQPYFMVFHKNKCETQILAATDITWDCKAEDMSKLAGGIFIVIP